MSKTVDSVSPYVYNIFLLRGRVIKLVYSEYPARVSLSSKAFLFEVNIVGVALPDLQNSALIFYILCHCKYMHIFSEPKKKNKETCYFTFCFMGVDDVPLY